MRGWCSLRWSDRCRTAHAWPDEAFSGGPLVLPIEPDFQALGIEFDIHVQQSLQRFAISLPTMRACSPRVQAGQRFDQYLMAVDTGLRIERQRHHGVDLIMQVGGQPLYVLDPAEVGEVHRGRLQRDQSLDRGVQFVRIELYRRG